MVGGGQGAFIGEVHRWAAALDQHIELVAGCFSRDYMNTKRTGEVLSIEPSRCYETYEQMFEAESRLPKSERIEFVSIVTPNSSHYQIAKSALEHGFHVMCDKPMTISARQAEELVSLVEKTGLLFGLTHNYTGNAMIREARELIRDGYVGKVRKVIVEYLQDCLALPLEKEGNKQISWRVDPAQAGVGGTLGDCGSHALNLLEFLVGQTVTDICADTSTYLPGRVLDEDVNILLNMKDGAKGIMTVSQIAVGHENDLRIRIYGDSGSICWHQEQPNELLTARLGEPVQIRRRGNGYLSAAASKVSRTPSGHPEGYLEAFANLYLEFSQAIRNGASGQSLVPTVQDGLRGVRFIEKAVESAKAGSIWVSL